MLSHPILFGKGGWLFNTIGSKNLYIVRNIYTARSSCNVMDVRTYHSMAELIAQKIQAAIAILTIMSSWIIAQTSIIDQGFDELFSLGLLMIAVVVIWKAFNKKDASETELLKEQIEVQKEHIGTLSKVIDTLRDDANEKS